MLSSFDCDLDWNSLDSYLTIGDMSPIARASSCPDLTYGNDLYFQEASTSSSYWEEASSQQRYHYDCEPEYPESPIDIIITDYDQAEDEYTPKFNLSKVSLKESFPYQNLYTTTPATKLPKCKKGHLHVPELDNTGKLSGRISRMSCRKCRSILRHPKIQVVHSSTPVVQTLSIDTSFALDSAFTSANQSVDSSITLTEESRDSWDACQIEV